MRYSAFISYNHRDRGWAMWLHRALEGYRIPKRLWGRASPWGNLGARLPPVFRDRDELATSSDLAASVQAALSDAATLVVICSPNSAASKWVDQEVRSFIDAGRRDRIRLIIVGGEPHAADPALECLPLALREGGPEPLAADIRKTADGKQGAKLKVLAGILDVPYDELRQREAARRQQRLAVLAAASFAGFLVMGCLTVFALFSRAEAMRQRQVAEQRTVTAERTLDFVQGMFQLADPSEARGASITAREIVDRATGRLTSSLHDQPTVRAELGVTLAEVYGALGLYQRSDRLIRWTFGIPNQQAATAARQLTALGESRLRLGEYPAAERHFRAARHLAGEASSDLRSRILAGLGQSLSALERFDEAENVLRNALTIDGGRGAVALNDTARDLEALGLNAMTAGKLEQAEPYFKRALVLRRRIEGDASPSVSDNFNSLGSIAYLRGDLALASRYFRGNLVSDEKVLGRDHPDTATTMNNLARVLLEQLRFREAKPLLERAMAISTRERGDTHDLMAFIFSNLAIIRRNQGANGEAEELFERAITAARAQQHRTLGPSLADLAEVRCATGRGVSAMPLLDEAARNVRQDYPDDPWRTAWVQSIRGECLWRMGRRSEGEALIKKSAVPITERWPRGTLFAEASTRRLILVGQ